MTSSFYTLMLLTNQQDIPLKDYLAFITACATAGVTSVQLREKRKTRQERLLFGQHLKACLDPLHIPLLINDDIDLAVALDASGVHLGQTDGDPRHAREVLGPHKYIGLSIDNESQLLQANPLPIDYVGIGAIFPTANKSNITTLWGLSGLEHIAPKSHHPIVAIGGITAHHIPQVMSSGASGIAVIGALHDTKHPKQTTQHLRQLIDTGDTHHVDS